MPRSWRPPRTFSCNVPSGVRPGETDPPWTAIISKTDMPNERKKRRTPSPELAHSASSPILLKGSPARDSSDLRRVASMKPRTMLTEHSAAPV